MPEETSQIMHLVPIDFMEVGSCVHTKKHTNVRPKIEASRVNYLFIE